MLGAYVKRVRSNFGCASRGDWPSVLEAFHPDVIYHQREDEPGARVLRSRDEVATMLAAWKEAFPELVFDVGQTIEVGDRVVADVTMRGRGRAHNDEVEQHYVFVYAMRDGLITEAWEFHTVEEALAALEAGSLSNA